MKVKVTNLRSHNGNPVPNQTQVEDDHTCSFISYGTIIAKVDKKSKAITLDSNYWDYSATTSKYRNLFLGLSTQEVKAGIATGIIRLENLN